MKIALIIGGTGQIGVYLAHQLLKKKYKVFISSRKITNHKKNKFKIINIYKKINFLKLNLYKKKVTATIFYTIFNYPSIDSIINLIEYIKIK